jgi:hypothetical protein
MQNQKSITPDDCLWDTVIFDEKQNIRYSRPKMWGAYTAATPKSKTSFHRFVMKVYLEVTYLI